MRLTQYTDFSLRVLVFLGVRGQERTTIKEISNAYGISHNHLMKVVQQLARLGYVESIRGAGGGIRLHAPPERINLGQLVRDMEPDFALVECMRPDNACVIAPVCRLPALLYRATDAFLAEFDACTLADLLPQAIRPDMAALLLDAGQDR